MKKKPSRRMQQQVLVRLPEDLHDELKRRSEAEERTPAQTLRLALKQYLARNPERQ